MTIGRKLVNATRRAVGPADDLVRLHEKIDLVVATLARQSELISQLSHQVLLDGPVAVRAELDSLGTAHAEGMVYLNRSMRDIRSQILEISHAVRRAAADEQPVVQP